MAKPKSKIEAAKAAARAHTDLNVFEGIVQMLEGGLVSADSYPAADRIIAICRKHEQVCLRRYDRALALLGDQQT